VRQALALGELDELRLDIAPVLLGEGERIFEPGVTPDLELLETEGSPYTTHVRYAVRR
jgi:dihydrofolate reductase